MSLTKESTGTTTLPSTSRPKTAAGEKIEDASQPQPVCIEVPVTVQGVRPATDPGKREPFTESTRTVIVFANGAVVRLGTAANSGQLLFLTNEHTKKEVVCQVVKSKTYESVAGYIELEFTEPSPGFWGIRFPGERSAASETEPKAPGVSPSSPKSQTLAPASLPPNPPAAAASLHADVPPKPELPLPSAEHESPAALPFASTPPVKPVAPPRPEPAQANSAPLLRAQGSTGLSEPLVFSSARKAAAAVPPKVDHHEDDHGAPTFGGRMFSDEDAETESVEAPPRRFPAVAVIAAGLILGAVGGGWYWWRNNAPGVANSAPPVNPPAPVSAPPSANTQTIPATSSPVPAQGSSKPVEASGHPSTPAPGQPQPVNASLISHEESKPAEKPLGSGEPANKAEKKPALASFRMSAPSAMRPPSPSRNLEPAPGIDSAPAVPGAASPEGIGLVGSAGLQPASPKPEPPAGGELKPARLTSSAPPVYPPLARSQRVEGDVTVDALIDATGRVTTIKVISGPVLLQQSAVAALHLWKYEPATLNGSAVPMHLVVTVKFRLR